MSELKIARRIKYQDELDLEFGHLVASMPGGEDLHRCIQCGTCSSTCPLSIYMDLTPRKIIAMIRAGFKDEVLSSDTIWLCTSCYSCTVECPRQIKITDIMYSLKQVAIREKRYPRQNPIPVLAQEFLKSVQETGRCNEVSIVARVWLKTNILKFFTKAGLGLRLLRRGRMNLLKERMDGGLAQMQTLLAAVDRENGTEAAPDGETR